MGLSPQSALAVGLGAEAPSFSQGTPRYFFLLWAINKLKLNKLKIKLSRWAYTKNQIDYNVIGRTRPNQSLERPEFKLPKHKKCKRVWRPGSVQAHWELSALLQTHSWIRREEMREGKVRDKGWKRSEGKGGRKEKGWEEEKDREQEGKGDLAHPLYVKS